MFKPLDMNAVRKLLKKTLNETLEELEKKHHVSLTLSDEAETFLARAGYSPEYGARELKAYCPAVRLCAAERPDIERPDKKTQALAGGIWRERHLHSPGGVGRNAGQIILYVRNMVII